MERYGLTDEQVALSRETYGSNAFSSVKKDGFFRKLLRNFGDPMIKILLVALAINVVFTALGQSEWFEPLGIGLAILIATFVSTYTEFKNENSFRTLQEEASRILCKVYRNGVLSEIRVDDVVVGDLVVLQTGDKIPADGVLLEGSLKVDQAALNGESEEAKKDHHY